MAYFKSNTLAFEGTGMILAKFISCPYLIVQNGQGYKYVVKTLKQIPLQSLKVDVMESWHSTRVLKHYEVCLCDYAWLTCDLFLYETLIIDLLRKNLSFCH